MTDSLTRIADTLDVDCLQRIKDFTEQTASHTDFNFWFEGAGLIAIVSLVIAILSLKYTHKTVISIDNEFEKNRLDKECQRILLIDIIRHLYRNKICTLAMRAKYMETAKGEHFCYPSEEHFLKMQLLPEDIHLEQYNRDDTNYKLLHDLDLKLRNYNTEIVVAATHAVNYSLPEEVKMRDFDTLEFKTGFLTSEIIKLLSKIWKERDGMEVAREVILECAATNAKGNAQNKKGEKYAEILAKLREDEQSRDLYFKNIFADQKSEFATILGDDLLIECGLNDKGKEKIYIIVTKQQQ